MGESRPERNEVPELCLGMLGKDLSCGVGEIKREADFFYLPVWLRIMGMVPGRLSFASYPSHPPHLYLAYLKCCNEGIWDNDSPPKPRLPQKPTNDGRWLAFFSRIATLRKGMPTDLNDTTKLLKIVGLKLLKKKDTQKRRIETAFYLLIMC